jgi:hypothetical protein
MTRMLIRNNSEHAICREVKTCSRPSYWYMNAAQRFQVMQLLVVTWRSFIATESYTGARKKALKTSRSIYRFSTCALFTSATSCLTCVTEPMTLLAVHVMFRWISSLDTTTLTARCCEKNARPFKSAETDEKFSVTYKKMEYLTSRHTSNWFHMPLIT